MKFVPVNVDTINEYACTMKKSKWLAYLDEFIASDNLEVEVVDDLGEYRSTTAICSSIRNAIKRFGYNVQVICRKGHVFLLKPKSVLYCE